MININEDKTLQRQKTNVNAGTKKNYFGRAKASVLIIMNIN